MRKKIAVFICAISFSSQKRVLEGILEEAKKNDIDVFIFTCHVNHSASYLKIKGAFSVMLLPDLKEFAGAIVMKNTILEPEIADELVQRIKDSGIPAVSIEEDIEGMHYVGISNYDAQKQVVEHIIAEHGSRRICYLTGLLDNREGTERFDAYKDAMKEHGLSVGTEDVFYGNYISLCGKDAVAQFLEKDRKPDAIICANDGMAMGVIHELQELGYKIPEEILVAGFDNDAFTDFSNPALTTVDQSQEEMGCCAVQMILGSRDGKRKVKNVEPKLICRESCGCNKDAEFSSERLRDTFGRQMTHISQAIDTMKNMSLELAGIDSMEILYERLKKYIMASDMEAFFLCTEKDSDQMEVPLSYRNGEFSEMKAYPKGNVLPDYVRDTKEPSFYVANSLFYGDENFGYIIQRGSRFVFESELSYSWITNVGVAIENINKIRIMQGMIDRLNTMWMYDTLTNIYNRGGFYHFAQPLLEQIKEKNGRCYLVFLDLDGLKQINDTIGHDAGDKCIVQMATAIKRAIKSEKKAMPIGMRYGGDEYVVFGECLDDEKPKKFLEKIRKEIEKLNRENKEFVLSCSMGYSIHDANKIEDLDKLIEEADMKMYEEKKAKKRARKVGGEQG